MGKQAKNMYDDVKVSKKHEICTEIEILTKPWHT